MVNRESKMSSSGSLPVRCFQNATKSRRVYLKNVAVVDIQAAAHPKHEAFLGSRLQRLTSAAMALT